MGDIINVDQEMCAFVSHDGKFLFFHRSDEKYGDLYWVNADIIVRRTPFPREAYGRRKIKIPILKTKII